MYIYTHSHQTGKNQTVRVWIFFFGSSLRAHFTPLSMPYCAVMFEEFQGPLISPPWCREAQVSRTAVHTWSLLFFQSGIHAEKSFLILIALFLLNYSRLICAQQTEIHLLCTNKSLKSVNINTNLVRIKNFQKKISLHYGKCWEKCWRGARQTINPWSFVCCETWKLDLSCRKLRKDSIV